MVSTHSFEHNRKDKTMLTPEESLILITKTIEDTKNRFKENGHQFIFWGILMFIVTISQFLILRLDLNIATGYPALLYPIGGIYSFIYARKEYKKKNLPKTIIGDIIFSLAAIMGANILVLAFFFSQRLGESMAPIFLILLAFFIFISGVAIKYKPLIIGGILLNLIGLSTFYFNWQYHPLIMSIGSVVSLIIPGILLNKNRKRENV